MDIFNDPLFRAFYESQLEGKFPKLRAEGYTITSPPTIDYNCIAWATEDNEKWWWPDQNLQYYWPDDIPRQIALPAFIALFEKFGYIRCNTDVLEKGFVKIAIFVNESDTPTHAARQLPSGQWTSKLGQAVDIQHTFSGLDSAEYGKAYVILKKALSLE